MNKEKGEDVKAAHSLTLVEQQQQQVGTEQGRQYDTFLFLSCPITTITCY